MLRYWVVIYVSIAAAAVLLLLGFSLWEALVPVLLLKLGADAWGAIRVDSNYYMKVLCKAPATEKAVALSFDDGPVDSFTPQILDILKEHQVPAAFFLHWAARGGSARFGEAGAGRRAPHRQP